MILQYDGLTSLRGHFYALKTNTFRADKDLHIPISLTPALSISVRHIGRASAGQCVLSA